MVERIPFAWDGERFKCCATPVRFQEAAVLCIRQSAGHGMLIWKPRHAGGKEPQEEETFPREGQC